MKKRSISMKILLINPPTLNAVKTNQSSYTISAVNFFPPINLLYLATTLKQRTNHSIKIIDADIERKDYQMIENAAKEENADIVGITAYSVAFYDCMETIRAVKRALPHAKICVGGSHTKYFAKETIEQPEIDYVFLGDAEYAFPELITILEKEGNVDDVKGIMYKKDGKVIVTGPPNVIKNLDELPFPTLDFIDYHKYYFAMGDSKPVAIIIGSRGCPHQCVFCQSANTGYRMRSVASMLNEIKHYLDHGITEFMFYDDTFNITAQRVIDFSKGVLEKGYTIKWSFRGRIDNVSEEMFKIAKEAGLILISYGVEDATDEGLMQMNRKQTLEQVFKGTALAKKYKILTSINFIIGLPTHKTKEDAMCIVQLAKKLKPDYCQLSVFVPHVGTKLYTAGVEKGILDPNFWTEYAKKPYKNAYIPFWEQYLTKTELDELIRKAYVSFYFNPKYIFQTLLNIKDMKNLYTKSKVGFNLFKLFVLSNLSIKNIQKSTVTEKKDMSGR